MNDLKQMITTGHFFAWWSFWAAMLLWETTTYKVHILGLFLGMLYELGVYFYNNYISSTYQIRDYRESVLTIIFCLAGSMFTIFIN